MRNTILIVLSGTVLIVGLILIFSYFSYSNEEIRLRETITAKIDDSRSHYTKMWEVLTNKAGISKTYASDFERIYPDLIEGRYSKGQGQMMNWIQEHNPEFDTSLYKDVMVSIEGQRESFHNNQRQLIDLNRQHSTLLKVAPSNWFLSSREPIVVPVIVNNETNETFKTGIESDMKLY